MSQAAAATGHEPPEGSHPVPASGARQRPLVVDLDGTLLRTDLLHETASAYLTRHPWRVAQVVGWLADGKVRLKRELASRHTLEPASLPYHPEVLDFVAEQRATGRHVVLATASLASQAEAVADHLGLFDEVLASSGDLNLDATRKRDLLVERFGAGGYDYVGNHGDDRAVWAGATDAYAVSDDRRLLASVPNVRQVFAPRHRSRGAALLRAARPHQWVKNLLLFLPLLAAHLVGDPTAVARSVLGFVLFSLTASSVYLFNDIADVASDRHHPKKRGRPFASGDLDLATGWVAWPALLVTSLVVSALLLPPLFTATLVGYLALTLAYTVDLKRRAVVDVVTLALLYTARIVAGAAATGAALSFWLLTFSLFFFLSLAFIKRVSELTRVRRTEGTTEEGVRGRGYVHQDLELLTSLGVTAGYAATVVLALYVHDARTAALYRTPQVLWASVPLILSWISRAWLVAHRGNMDEDPILYAVRDRVSLVIGALVLLVFLVAKVAAL